MDRGVSRILLRLAVKTQTVALVVIFITATALTLIVNNVEVDSYR